MLDAGHTLELDELVLGLLREPYVIDSRHAASRVSK